MIKLVEDRTVNGKELRKVFVDTVNDIYFQKRQTTNLKQKRLEAGLSQSELSKLSGVPVRTIQQYEQRQSCRHTYLPYNADTKPRQTAGR